MQKSWQHEILQQSLLGPRTPGEFEFYSSYIMLLLIKLRVSYLRHRWSDLRRFWFPCLCPLVYLLQKLLSYVAFQSFDRECTWGMLFQKPVVCTRFDIYVFNTIVSICSKSGQFEIEIYRLIWYHFICMILFVYVYRHGWFDFLNSSSRFEYHSKKNPAIMVDTRGDTAFMFKTLCIIQIKVSQLDWHYKLQ